MQNRSFRFSNLLIILLLLAVVPTNAQQRDVFSGSSDTYVDELYNLMKNLPEQYEESLEHFVEAWEEDSLFDQQQMADIIEISDLMIKRKARPYPHFYNFMNVMLAFEEKSPETDNYYAWIKGYKALLEKRKTKTSEYNNLLEVTYGLLMHNYLYSSNSTIWKANAVQYSMQDTRKGLRVEFPSVDLVCYAKRDSIHLFETKGTLDPVENIWNGEGGLVTWERGGYSRDQVFAHLPEYEIDLTRSDYKVEDVTFTNKIYFDEPLMGYLEDKVMVNNTPENATYPKFYSYTKKFVIDNLYENIDYEGGLSMQGAKMVGTGTRENTAKLKIYRNDTLVLTASSVFFGFRADRVSSQRTSITIKLHQDSIYHPDLFFTYRVRNKELTLLKTDNYSSKGPYSNSYHKVDMNFDQLSWRMDENVMRFTAPRGAALGNAYFESVNYFNYNKYMAMMMLDEAHPLYLLKKFAQTYGNDQFPTEAYASFLQLPMHQVQQLAMRMAFGGFVFYDSNTETITLKQRLYDYLAASINKIDYDVMAFESNVEAPLENAVYNIKNNDLIINGIPQIQVSDSQNVVIYPRNNQIVLKNNRNFQFDGVVDAGLLTFFGNNFFFSYDSFKINLQNVDSLQLEFLTGQRDGFGLPISERVRNRLQHITGDVLIDKPDNKSGRESYPEYPIFISKEKSYVFYDNANVESGVYESSDFFFEVEPFVMDSLDNFNYQDLNFKGEFVSAGIFPAFAKELSLQSDNSLGFRHMTPPEGFPLYGGKGTFNNEIWLSNNGLRGDGELKYLTSTTWSDDFIFYPDSMNTRANQYQIARKDTATQYPKVQSVNNYIHWMPYADVMYANRTDTDFNMFNDSTYLKGNLTLTPSLLSGTGRMDLKNSDLKSNYFTYKAQEIFADTADFFLKSLSHEGFTVLSENMNSHIDYRQRKGWFKSNEDFALVNFPDNKYVSYLDYYIWDMMKKELAMGAPGATAEVDYTDEDSEPEGPRYISLHHEQDSLNFVSPLAYYDYANNYINAKGVKFVEVADSRIYPDKGELTVERDAEMRTLVNSRIRTNTQSKFHTIHTATVNIEGKQYFTGQGNFDYVDENDEIQLIHFSDIKVDDSLQTIASGDIYEAANFKVSPVYQYQGKVYLNSQDSLLDFKGSLMLEDNCEYPNNQWVYFQTRINPDDIYIPVPEQTVNINREKIYSGMFLHYDSVHVFPAWFSSHKSYSDNPLVSSYGFLHYDKASQLYKIGTKEKINDFLLPEDYLSFHRENCELYGEGQIRLGADLGQVKLNSFGSLRHNVEANETELDIVLMVDFFMADPMIKLMAYEIDSAPNLEPVDLSRSVWTKTVNRLVGEETAQKMRDELSLFGTIKELPPELKHTIIFNELKLKWDDARNAYQSVGMIGIASIDDVQINKRVNGYMELQIKRSGDIFDIYLEIDKRTYYYFGYTRGVMQTLSSNQNYVEPIMNMKTRERKMKVPRNQTSYIYMISTDRKRNNFYRRYRNAVEGIEDSGDDDDE